MLFENLLKHTVLSYLFIIYDVTGASCKNSNEIQHIVTLYYKVCDMWYISEVLLQEAHWCC